MTKCYIDPKKKDYLLDTFFNCFKCSCLVDTKGIYKVYFNKEEIVDISLSCTDCSSFNKRVVYDSFVANLVKVCRDIPRNAITYIPVPPGKGKKANLEEGKSFFNCPTSLNISRNFQKDSLPYSKRQLQIIKKSMELDVSLPGFRGVDYLDEIYSSKVLLPKNKEVMQIENAM